MVEYLSDLSLITVNNGLGPIERNRNNGNAGATDGGIITLNGVAYEKGLGVYANSELRYCLDGLYTKFLADTGIDDSVAPNGTVEFQVWADGVQLFKSGVLTNDSQTRSVEVNVTGKHQLVLLTVTEDGEANDLADWANARFVRTPDLPVTGAPNSSVFLSDLNLNFTTNGLGPIEKDKNNGGEAANDGGPLQLNGTKFAKGLGVYPTSDVRLCLRRNYSRFIAEIGIDDAVAPKGAATFQVIADGLVIYDSGMMTNSSSTQSINVSILGKNELQLLVTAVDTQPPPHFADWANARLIVADNSSSAIGQWEAPITWPFVSVHTSELPNGKVLFWRGSFGDSADIAVWDPLTNKFTSSNVPARTPVNNIFCTGHTFLPDGKLLVTGGHINSGVGLPYSNIYDYATNTWAQGPDMNAGRWYPTNCTLANGEVLVVSGSIGNLQEVNTLPQVWTLEGSWRSLTSAQLRQPLYPWMHLAPNGKVFNSGPDKNTRYLDTSGTGAWSTVATSSFSFRDYGSSVLYADGKILIVGGGNSPLDHNLPTNTAEVIDLNAATPVWREVGRMSNARRQLNATLLPDGTVLVTGGTSGGGFNNEAIPVYSAELWNPELESWTTLAEMKTPRMYHSTAVLLLDGRVVCSGGGQGGDPPYFNYASAEIYSPPYLFHGPRPVLASAPESVTYNQKFNVGTPDSAGIAKVTWIRLPSVTHAFDANQRINRLEFSRSADGLTIQSPNNRNLSPPGHYMLFLLNEKGVPSIARIIRLG